MKTTKNKTIQDLSIVVSALFHWFVLAATDRCLPAQKRTKPTVLIEGLEKMPPTAAIGDKDPVNKDIKNPFIENTTDLEESFDENKQTLHIHSSYSDHSHKANQQTIKVQNDGSKSSSGLYQSNASNRSNEIAASLAEKHVDGSNNDADQNQKTDNNSANVQCSEPTEHTIEHNVLSGKNLPPLLKDFETTINTLKSKTEGLKVVLSFLYKSCDQKRGKQRVQYEKLLENYKGLLKDIDRFYKENDFSDDYLSKLLNTNEENQKKYIESAKALAVGYIKKLNECVGQAQSHIEKAKKESQGKPKKAKESNEDKENSKKICLTISKENTHKKNLYPAINSGNGVNLRNDQP